jgi:outer membrane protein TolC
MERSPALGAHFERWRAEVARIARARRLPDPKISYAYYVRNVETRVGPQRHRLGLRQAFPWPTELVAGGQAATAAARAAQRRFEAAALDLEAQVAAIYFRLWRVHEVHRIASAQEALLVSLIGSVEAKVETGQATMADLLQAQLRLTWHQDHHAAHREMMMRLTARLRSVIGAPADVALPVAGDAPPAGLPAKSAHALAAELAEHPRVQVHRALAAASERAAARQRAKRWPGFVVGMDWIETGPARSSGVQDSGKDAVMASIQVDVPLFQRSYRQDVEAQLAQERAHRADADSTLAAARAELTDSLSSIRDAERRIHLHERTLVPQGRTVLESMRGSYEAGQASLAQLLMAEGKLLELENALAEARADHAVAWAELEALLGTEVERRAGDVAGADAAGADAAGADAAHDHARPPPSAPHPSAPDRLAPDRSAPDRAPVPEEAP